MTSDGEALGQRLPLGACQRRRRLGGHLDARSSSGARCHTRGSRHVPPGEEGAFYGDVFTPEGEPIIAYACRGHAQAAGEAGSLGAGPAARA